MVHLWKGVSVNERPRDVELPGILENLHNPNSPEAHRA